MMLLLTIERFSTTVWSTVGRKSTKRPDIVYADSWQRQRAYTVSQALYFWYETVDVW